MVTLEECKLEMFNSGKGGQGQNKRPCNVRLTHLSSGVMVTVRGRSKRQNVAAALKEINKRVQDSLDAKAASAKKARRDEKIHEHVVVRTYDFVKQYAKNHRTGTKLHLKKLMAGELDFYER